MKYPHIDPAGGDLGGPGWRLAGIDLPAAVGALAHHDGTVVETIRLAEVLRRQGKSTESRALLRVPRPRGHEIPLVALATANTYWTQGNAADARAPYAEAVRGYTELDDVDGVLAARIGLARCARMTYDKSRLAVLDAAVDAGRRCEDSYLLADLDRERAAWDLLTGDHDSALHLADRAAAVHRAVGDLYLLGLADVLRARAMNGTGDRLAAIDLVRAQIDRAIDIGSDELKMVGVVYLAQFLQRGVVVGTPEWAAAKEIINDALEAADDPFTQAELILPLAHLHTTAGEFAEAQRCLDEYGRLYRALGGNKIGEANLLKARARLELARNGGLSLRSLRHLPRSLKNLKTIQKAFKQARRVYEEAGLTSGVDNVQWHIELVDILGAGHSTGARRLRSDARDALDRTRDYLLYAELQNSAGNSTEALAAYQTAETEAVHAGATTFAVAAAAGSAEMAYALHDAAATTRHLRSAVDHAESIRAAVATGTARRHIANTLRAHYEHAMLLAAKLDDGDLVVEIAERLRTERLAGLLRRGHTTLPADLAGLLDEIGRVNDALTVRDPSLRGVRSALPIDDLADHSHGELVARLDELRGLLAERTNDLFADAFGAEPVRMRRLAALREDVLIIVPVSSADGDQIVSVWRSPSGACHAAVVAVSEAVAELRTALTQRDMKGRITLLARSLAPLRALLPDAFREFLIGSDDPIKLVVVPTGWLWAVPFAALPLSPDASHLLVDHADTVLTPSLRFLTALTDRIADTDAPPAAVSWLDPEAGFQAPELAALASHPAGHVTLTGTHQLKDAFVRGGGQWRTAVLAAHGNRSPGLAHAVTAGRQPVLTAADFLDGDAHAPRYLSLTSCHSGFPDGDDQHEPLGLALTALAAGATSVLSAHFEIDSVDGPMRDCLTRLYRAMPDHDSLPALLAHILRDRTHRGPSQSTWLYQWAALTVIGTH